MPGCKRTPAARGLAPLSRALGVAAGIATLALTAGCSSDVTRFNLLGADFFGTQPQPSPRPASSPVGYAPASHGPPGYAPSGYAPPGRSSYPGAPGNGLQETSLSPVAPASGQDYYRPPGRDQPTASAAPYPPPRAGDNCDLVFKPHTSDRNISDSRCDLSSNSPRRQRAYCTAP